MRPQRRISVTNAPPRFASRLSGSALNPQQLVPVRCVARRNEFSPKSPGLALTCRAEADRATAEAGIELIDRTHALKRARVVGLIEEAVLDTAGRHQIEKCDAGFLVAIPWLEDDAERRHCCRDELAGISRRNRQPHSLRGIVLPLLGFEGVGFNLDRETRRCEVLASHLFRHARGIDGSRLYERVNCPLSFRVGSRPRFTEALTDDHPSRAFREVQRAKTGSDSPSARRILHRPVQGRAKLTPPAPIITTPSAIGSPTAMSLTTVMAWSPLCGPTWFARL